MAIQSLTQGALSSASLLAFFDTTNGRDAQASVASLAALLQTLLALGSEPETQYAAPAATGFGVLAAPSAAGGSVQLLLTPTATFAAGTITLPAQATCADRQTVRVACTQIVTALTVAGNGSTVNGAPTTLAANAFFWLRYDAIMKAWYRIA